MVKIALACVACRTRFAEVDYQDITFLGSVWCVTDCFKILILNQVILPANLLNLLGWIVSYFVCWIGGCMFWSRLVWHWCCSYLWFKREYGNTILFVYIILLCFCKYLKSCIVLPITQPIKQTKISRAACKTQRCASDKQSKITFPMWMSSNYFACIVRQFFAA